MDFFNLHKESEVNVPARGKLLIAEPLLNDPNFSRSVIFLCEHGEEGSIGFVLNQATSFTLQDLLPELYVSHMSIFQGGPVEADTLHMVHRINEIPGRLEIAPGIYWGGDYEVLKDMIWRNTFDPTDIRLFIGYSGWAPGQLDREMREGSWLVADTPPEFIFETDPNDVWKNAIGLLGKKYSYLANIPTNPRNN
jgi:putative transcriptional regulator